MMKDTSRLSVQELKAKVYTFLCVSSRIQTLYSVHQHMASTNIADRML